MGNVPVIGLDLSLTATGIVVLDEDGKSHGYTFGYPLKKPSQTDKLERLLKIASYVNGVAKKHKVKYVGFEKATFGNKIRALELASLTTVVTTQLYLKFKMIPAPIAIASIRKYILGNCRCECKDEEGKCHCFKDRVEKELRSRGHELKNQDEYDALAVAQIVFDWANVVSGSEYQRGLLKKINTMLG